MPFYYALISIVLFIHKNVFGWQVKEILINVENVNPGLFKNI
jgi:hypothetical protein